MTRPPGGRWRRRSLLAAAGSLGCSARPGAAASFASAFPLDPLPAGSRLQPLGGLELDNAAIGFGGFSGLHLDADLRLTAISDTARWLTGTLVLRDGRPQALEAVRTGPLRDGMGAPLTRGHLGDAEALARLPDGTWLVGFESWHRIRAYRDLDGPGLYVEAPPGLERAGGNKGLETLAVLADGSWLAMAEKPFRGERPDLVRAWLGSPQGASNRWRSLAYRPAEGFSPVDAAAMPGGGALVLERRFTWLGGFETRIVWLPAAALRGGGVLEGEEMLRFAPPLPAENFEGLSLIHTGGRTLVAVVSDDNENFFQRSLLLLFTLAER